MRGEKIEESVHIYTHICMYIHKIKRYFVNLFLIYFGR